MKTIYIILGPSGSGKTTLGKKVEKRLGIPELVSTTTREPRVGEIDGIHYNFITYDDFHEQDFIEINDYAGNLYGLSLKAVHDGFSKNTEKVFVIAEKHGAEQIINYYKKNESIHVVSMFLKTSLTIMKERMENRGDNEKDIEKRLKNAKETNELKTPDFIDYIIDANQGEEDVYNSFKNIIKKEGLI